MRRSQVFLRDGSILSYFHDLCQQPGLTLEVGSGKGALLRALPLPRKGIEIDSRFRPHLQGEDVIWKDFLHYEPDFLPVRLVGNLPFGRTLQFLERTYEYYPLTPAYYILQAEVADRLLSANRLGFLVRTLYRVRFLRQLSGQDFQPVVKVKAKLLEFLPKLEGTHDWQDYRAISRQLRRLTAVRKRLGKTFPTLKLLGQKRLDQLNSEEQVYLREYLVRLDQGNEHE